MFCLKLYDIPLLCFDFIEDPLDGQQVHISRIETAHSDLFPIGLTCTDAGLMSWLKTRIIPKNREFVNAFLAKNGLNQKDICGILRVCRGLSLNDSYWITENDFSGSFSEYNLYEHDFVKVLSLIAYTGYGSTKASSFTSSPEFTTTGMLRKGWRRLQGKTLLYKGGTSGAANTGNEPYSEYYAAQIAEQMGLPHVAYGLAKWKGSLCSTCELFTDIDHSYVPIYRFVETSSLRNTSAYLKSLGESYYQAFSDMLIFDALIYNEDRHFGNFGLMVDSHTNQPYSFAPIFDNGLSLFNYAMSDDLEHVDDYAKTRLSAYGVPFDNIAREFITRRQKEQLRRMIGFTFKQHPTYRMPASRTRILEDHLQHRVRQLLDIQND